ncbi:nucleotidyltransferase domain-containing protein [Rhizobium sp. CB3090]|uniref:nucleotidyltransferase domain-containing protein n=1 Tax=Rhizobium sp. CB3090 TaxID=3039156 RepID=UPI0024B12F74|nr:nucleotidyltransferase domain-containing protein [Rhizobium sp. CB3090]WFU08541.1 nucleotidyltransferase domain-containing protein [Rhizobium sp. CB3090]
MTLESFAPEAVAEIRLRLASVKSEGIRIGLAIESGSRAWGFPSPDSDYDCRFVYIRPERDHFSLFPHRDVIEFPIVGDIDTGGWELRKALLLALKGNAVLVEWLKSPLVYEEEPGFRKRLSALLETIMVPEKVAHHYIGLMKQNRPGDEAEPIRLKKLLYGIRPAIALEWMRQTDFAKLPPMNMLECLEDIDIAESMRATILQLVALKKETREMGEGAPPAQLTEFLSSSLARYSDFSSKLRQDAERDKKMQQLANHFYLDEVRRVKP